MNLSALYCFNHPHKLRSVKIRTRKNIIYAEYRKAKKSPAFYEAHRAEIALYESARDALREISGGEKLPSMKVLKEEKDRLTASKNAQYETYQTARTEQRELQTVLTNVQQMLGIKSEHTTAQVRDKGIT